MEQQERIRERAFALWVEAGSPEGQDLEFWHRAEQEIAAEQNTGTPDEEGDLRQAPVEPGALSR